MGKSFDAQVVFLGKVINLLDCRIDLHYAVGHFIHAVFQAERQAVEFVHFFKDAAFMASGRTLLGIVHCITLCMSILHKTGKQQLT